MNIRLKVVGVALATSLFGLSQTAIAQDAEEDNWSGKATLGYLATSGNTENSTLNTGVEVGFTTGKWVHTAAAAAITASEDGQPTAEAYDLGWKTERQLTEKDFLFGRLEWRKDNFGAYDTQFSQTLGYGRRLLDNDKHKLNVEVGAGARQSELQLGGKESETIVTAGGFYSLALSETASFQQNVTTESGSDNTYLESYTALSAKVFGDLALVASYTIKHNTDVPDSTEKTDTYSALSLEYKF